MHDEIIKWVKDFPELSGDFYLDIDSFQKYIASGERLLLGLPVKKLRNEDEYSLAEIIHSYSRKLRIKLLSKHSETIYEILTNNRSVFLRLDELSYKASEVFEGLTPSKSTMDEEQKKNPYDREVREFDQAIFISQILHSNKSGSHLLESMRRPLKKSQDLQKEFIKIGRVDLGKVALVRRENGATYITIQNEEHLNAEDNELMDDLEVAVDLVNLDPKSQVGIMRGGVMTHPSYLGRRIFSAGINLKYLGEGKIPFLNFFLGREMGLINKIQRGLCLETLPSISSAFGYEKPWLAVVDTFAIGGGAQLLLAFDKVIAASNSYIILPAANEGFIPGAANLRLTRFCGSRFARQLIFDGKKIKAEQEESKYFFDRVVDQNDIDEFVELEVNLLMHPATIANRRMLLIAEETEDRFREYMANFCINQLYCIYNQEIINKIKLQWK